MDGSRGPRRPASGRDARVAEDLLAARRVLDRVLEAVVAHEAARDAVLAKRDDRRREDRAMQLRLDLAECPAAAAVLWELVGEEQRQTATGCWPR